MPRPVSLTSIPEKPSAIQPQSVLQPAVALVGRICLAAMFIPSGMTKITQMAPTIDYIAAAGLPVPELALSVAIAVEVIGGLLLVLGYYTRLAAVALATFTAAAAFGFHANFADQNQMIHFMKNVAIVGGLLQVAAYGASRFSFDAAFRR